MSAPAGSCGGCGSRLQWTVIDGVMMVRCRICYDLFDGTEAAVSELREDGDGDEYDDLPF